MIVSPRASDKPSLLGALSFSAWGLLFVEYFNKNNPPRGRVVFGDSTGNRTRI